MSDLRVSELARQFSRTRPSAAVEDVSFSVPKGTLTTLLGPSGCGKTTTLRMIAGLESPTHGKIFIGGRDVTLVEPEHRGVGMVFQSYALFPHLTVLQNVMFPLDAAGSESAIAEKQASAALEMVGLLGLEHRTTPALSGGQQQRVALARALALAPEVLLLDEPLSNVDARLRRSLREEIRSLQRRLNLTVVYVTHDQREALAVSDQIVLMNAGRVEQIGTPHDLYERPQTEFVASFMAQARIFEAQCARDGKVRLGGLEILTLAGHPEGQVQVVIRPDAWHIGPATGSGLAGSILRKTYLGQVFEYLISTPIGHVIVVTRHTANPLDEGAPVSLSLADHGVSEFVNPVRHGHQEPTPSNPVTSR